MKLTGCPNFEEPAGAATRVVTVSSLVIVNGFESALARYNESPTNDATTLYAPAACVGVIEHATLPDASVTPLQLSPVPSVNVTVLPTTGPPPVRPPRVAEAANAS
ncbi:MAG: hypothetical protein QOH12_3433 [Solirubrobacteraceae bacterium]|jgi:hypothetical protein|nr:hypothetical protein [Solirubrobacteraceae bacterium]